MQNHAFVAYLGPLDEYTVRLVAPPLLGNLFASSHSLHSSSYNVCFLYMVCVCRSLFIMQSVSVNEWRLLFPREIKTSRLPECFGWCWKVCEFRVFFRVPDLSLSSSSCRCANGQKWRPLLSTNVARSCSKIPSKHRPLTRKPFRGNCSARSEINF